jgi:hemin uptake protein HemP
MSGQKHGSGKPAAAGTREPPLSAPRRISSEELLSAGQPLHIEHGDQLYILRQTGSGKLILTK